MKITTKQLVQTALLLALCIVFQTLKALSVYITGSLVNAVLILATLSIGLFGGLMIALASPVVAFLLGATPVMNLIPAMIPVVMAGNSIVVLAVYFLKKKNLVAGLLTGAVCKAGFLWLAVWFAILPLFSGNIPEAKRAVMVATVKTQFSLTQLITALIGSLIAWLVWARMKKVLTKENG